MKIIPITLNSKAVNTTLSGKKSVIRLQLSDRVLADLSSAEQIGEIMSLSNLADQDYILSFAPCKKGDLIYIRETWGVISHDYDNDGNHIKWIPNRPATPIKELKFGQGYYSGHAIYRADGEQHWSDDYGDEISAWKPSIHMPKSISRITLKVKDVRLDRVQDITEEQAIKEGMPTNEDCQHMAIESNLGWYQNPVTWFKNSWNEIHDNWSENPYVWVIEFDVVHLNVNSVVTAGNSMATPIGNES